MLQLTGKQQKVLTNILAWTNHTPTDEGVEAFFGCNDRGQALPPIGTKERVDCVELQWGWLCHYGDEFSWIQTYEAGGNAPTIPPQAWIFDAYWANPNSGAWMGWQNLLLDYLRCGKEEWLRKRPAFTRAYVLSVYFHKVRDRAWLKDQLTAQKG